MDRHDEDPFAVKSPYSRLGASASQLERTSVSTGVDMDFNVTLAVQHCRPPNIQAATESSFENETRYVSFNTVN